jgi:hypothetical protein
MTINEFCLSDGRGNSRGRLLPFQEPSPFEYRRHRLLDSRHRRRRLLRRSKWKR